MASRRDLDLKAQAWNYYQITTHLPAENIRVYDESFAKCKLDLVCLLHETVCVMHIIFVADATANARELTS